MKLLNLVTCFFLGLIFCFGFGRWGLRASARDVMGEVTEVNRLINSDLLGAKLRVYELLSEGIDGVDKKEGKQDLVIRKYKDLMLLVHPDRKKFSCKDSTELAKLVGGCYDEFFNYPRSEFWRGVAVSKAKAEASGQTQQGWGAQENEMRKEAKERRR
jgi:hypothetical protein